MKHNINKNYQNFINIKYMMDLIFNISFLLVLEHHWLQCVKSLIKKFSIKLFFIDAVCRWFWKIGYCTWSWGHQKRRLCHRELGLFRNVLFLFTLESLHTNSHSIMFKSLIIIIIHKSWKLNLHINIISNWRHQHYHLI